MQQSSPPRSTPKNAGGPASAVERPATRLVSLDAYRGFIMVMLAASGFGIARFAALPPDAPVWQDQDRDAWQAVAFHFNHPPWESRVGLMGVSFWDLIQPAFMFMVGVAMPFSYAKRKALGHSAVRRFAHACWRAAVLVLLGVFLYSMNDERTDWIFTNVLAQIGLGYVFAYVLLGRKEWVQWTAFAAILVGTWYLFWQYQPADAGGERDVQASVESGDVYEGKFAPWSKNANVAHAADVVFLNLLRNPPDDELHDAGARYDSEDWVPFPIRQWFFDNSQAFRFNSGGYQTLNFLPSIATTLLGILSAQFLIRRRRSWRDQHWQTVGILIGWGAACMIAALAADEYVCPIIKRIWTPSWVLFSGAYVIWMLALFYALFDILPLRKLAFPLVVVGMNSIAAYLMGQLIRGWTVDNVVHTHLGGLLTTLIGEDALADDMYGRLIDPTIAFLVFWLILLWMYRQRYFVRI